MGVSAGVSSRGAGAQDGGLRPFRPATGAEGLSAAIQLIERLFGAQEIGRLSAEVTGDPLARAAKKHVEIGQQIIAIFLCPNRDLGKRSQRFLDLFDLHL